jgi:hypothetical protein
MGRFTSGEVAQHAHVRLETLRYTAREGCVAGPLRGVSHYRWPVGSPLHAPAGLAWAESSCSGPSPGTLTFLASPVQRRASDKKTPLTLDYGPGFTLSVGA